MSKEMRKHIDTFKDRMLKENKSGFIVGSEPLDKSMKLKEKLKKIISELEVFENSIIYEFHSESEDYTKEIYQLAQKISSLTNDIKIDDLEISLGDFNFKNKGK
jgi:hypothetical protein